MERYPTLGFEVVLGPDDYLLIGCPADAANSLGSALFTVEVNCRPRQRVLVVRAGDSSGIPMDLPALPRPRGGSAIAAQTFHPAEMKT